jgi:uncharacterized protein (DUF924 family)
MTENSRAAAPNVLDFWFGTLDETGQSDAAHQKNWWSKDPAFDATVRDSFAATYVQLAFGNMPSVDQPLEFLSRVILLDQFPRNMFRDTPAMFASDELARLYAYELTALGFDRPLPAAYRPFAYMPLMHSERLVDQERCVELFQIFADESSGEVKSTRMGLAKYAIAHRDIINQFGRFPHRNHILGRVSTDAEIAFLKEPGSSF